MTWIMDRIGSAAAMREMDRAAIEDHQIPGLVLMENAGRGAFEFLMEEFSPRRVTVLAGKGNNGGDGYVIARHLLNAGVAVDTIILAGKDEIAGDAKTNLDALMGMGAVVNQASVIDAFDDYRYQIVKSDLIVDAILGTGVAGEVKGFYRHAINLINGLVEDNPHLRVFAVDLPSGLNADTGQVMGTAVVADATATFGMLKSGLLSYPGARLTGSLALIDISLPRALYEDVPGRLVTVESASSLLPCRDEDCHKGVAGHGLVIAGSPGKTGAAVMAAESALKVGAGLVTLAGPAGLARLFELKTLEVMTEPLPESEAGLLGKDAIDRALELIDEKTAIALGPGLGRDPSVRELVSTLIAKRAAPLVIDADGLNAVAEDVSMLIEKGGPVILTPHPGEMARLLGSTTKAVLADRLQSALEFAKLYGVVVALKGAYTIVACPDGRAFYNTSGNPGMATGGTGDVLTGAILGLLCQGLDAVQATVLAVFLHGFAGDLAADDRGEEGMIASDVMRLMPDAMRELEALAAEDDE